MSISFFKHKTALIDAYKDVLNDATDTDWALFTYEGKENELKVAGTGDEGLEELESEFNSSKIMYAFIRVKDPKTSLNKFIFLHWQGEGAPANRKGACANHVRDVERFFKGAHITINARNEDDVTPEQIMEHVNRASASTYAFDKQQGGGYDQPSQPVGTVYQKINPAQDISVMKKQGGNHDVPSGPVGSVYQKTNAAQDINKLKQQGGGHDAPSGPVGTSYKRINPAEDITKLRSQSVDHDDGSSTPAVGSVYQRTNAAHEINSSKNDSYWSQQDREEQERRKEEQKRKAEERQKYMEDIKAQERESAQRRLEWEKAREREISEKMRAAKLADDRKENLEKEKARYEQEQREYESASQRGRKRSESTEKAAEAAHLVHKRGENVKQMWHERIAEANKPAPAPERAPLRARVGSIENYQPSVPDDDNAFQRNTPSGNDNVYHDNEPETQQHDYHEPQQAYEPAQQTYDDVSQDQFQEQHNTQPVASYQEPEVTYDDVSTTQTQQYEPQEPPQELYEDVAQSASTGHQAKAIYDYQAADDTEISFDPDDIITNIDMIDEGWWQGMAPNGAYGLFPANYVELLE